MKFSQGELVRWYLVYDVGMVKDSGIGIILDTFKYAWQNDDFPMYKVLRNEYSDVMVFEEYAVEKYNGEKNEIK